MSIVQNFFQPSVCESITPSDWVFIDLEDSSLNKGKPSGEHFQASAVFCGTPTCSSIFEGNGEEKQSELTFLGHCISRARLSSSSCEIGSTRFRKAAFLYKMSLSEVPSKPRSWQSRREASQSQQRETVKTSCSRYDQASNSVTVDLRRKALVVEAGLLGVRGNVAGDGKIKEVFCLKYSLKETAAVSSTVGERGLEGVTGNTVLWHI